MFFFWMKRVTSSMLIEVVGPVIQTLCIIVQNGHNGHVLALLIPYSCVVQMLYLNYFGLEYKKCKFILKKRNRHIISCLVPQFCQGCSSPIEVLPCLVEVPSIFILPIPGKIEMLQLVQPEALFIFILVTEGHSWVCQSLVGTQSCFRCNRRVNEFISCY